MKGIILFCILLGMTGLANAESSVGRAQQEKSFKEWTAKVLAHDTQTLFRALTVDVSKTDEISILALDRRTDDCGSIFISTIIALDAPTDQSIELEGQDAMFRVDSRQIHNVKYDMIASMGDEHLFLEYRSFENEGAGILKDIREGATLRVKLNLGEKAYYKKFKLQGSSSALDWTYRKCTAEAPSDSDFFETDLRPTKSDEDFFGSV